MVLELGEYKIQAIFFQSLHSEIVLLWHVIFEGLYSR